MKKVRKIKNRDIIYISSDTYQKLKKIFGKDIPCKDRVKITKDEGGEKDK